MEVSRRLVDVDYRHAAFRVVASIRLPGLASFTIVGAALRAEHTQVYPSARSLAVLVCLCLSGCAAASATGYGARQQDETVGSCRPGGRIAFMR